MPVGAGAAGNVVAEKECDGEGFVGADVRFDGIWFVTQQESRFLIHVYVLGAVFAVLGWTYVLESAGRYSRFLVAVAVAISVSYGMLMIARARKDDVHAVLSPAYSRARSQAEVPFFDSFQYINSQPSATRVLILDRSVPPYYSDKPYLKPVGQWGERPLPGAPDAAEALRRIQEWRVSHVLDVQSEVAPFQVRPDMRGLSLVLESTNQRVYAVQ